eukprot:GEMP01062358.1.p1 GENE.GEMP01062358.1~~GEMP01062358.1.p1  ORF type:complete len:321 (+),score=59.65 GEMP01062358.1:101-1063(+)
MVASSSRHVLRVFTALSAGAAWNVRSDSYCEEIACRNSLPSRIDRWRRSAAQIYDKDPREKSAKYLGSAFALDPDFLVTAAHIFDKHGGGPVAIRLGDGSCYSGTLRGASKLMDIAVIQVTVGMESEIGLEWADRRPYPGEQSLVIGTPNYASECISVCGQIVNNRQTFPNLDEAPECPVGLLQVSVPTVPGMSGSVLLDPESGQIQGVMVKKFLEFGIALPVDVVRPVVCALKEDGKWEPRRLGMSVNEDMMVTNVECESVASQAGFQRQDKILVINGTRIGPTMSTLLEVLWFGNCAIEVQIQRQHETLTVIIPLPSP